ncbi:hypothetical protein SDC9_112423 [bioreactor metagenome]|uniref:Uncharacterized protein n=1 Tax=bioreactor metagenome TaxID=1076179 RepID=A0A645BJY3_9ZZZZ
MLGVDHLRLVLFTRQHLEEGGKEAFHRRSVERNFLRRKRYVLRQASAAVLCVLKEGFELFARFLKRFIIPQLPNQQRLRVFFRFVFLRRAGQELPTLDIEQRCRHC